MYAPNPADNHWEVRLYTVWNYILAHQKLGTPVGCCLSTEAYAHLWLCMTPYSVARWSMKAGRHGTFMECCFFFFLFFDTTDIWKWFASFLWKLGWGLFKPTSEDTHLERRFYILLFLGSTWLFPSHLLATIWILILCVCSFVHSFIHSTNMISMPVVRLTMVLGAGLRDRYMSPYSETRLYTGIKYIFFANLCEAIYSHKTLLHPW